jgi:hypothetical protein
MVSKMECTGKIVSIPSQDIRAREAIVTLVLKDVSISAMLELNSLQTSEALSFSLKKYLKKRSLDANAYVWVIMTEIAKVLKSSKEEIYEEMLQRYGNLYEDEDGFITITVKNIVDMRKIDGHWKRYKEDSTGKFVSYLKIKGSSEYNTAEMSHFIDCVVQEAKELGIETLPPAELERMMQCHEPRKNLGRRY